MAEHTLNSCPKHNPVQHRDSKPPWCNLCGWTTYYPEIQPIQIAIRYISEHKIGDVFSNVPGLTGDPLNEKDV